MNCLLCGQPPPLTENLCPDCFAQRTVLASLPEVVEVTHCPRCDALMRGPRWIDEPNLEATLAHLVEDHVSLDPRASKVSTEVKVIPQDPYSRGCQVTVQGEVEGVELATELECRLMLKRQVCPPCSRAAGGYYEAILQVRGLERMSSRRLDRIAAQLEARLDHGTRQDRNFFAARKERVKGGLDYYLSTLGGARNLAKGLLAEHGGTSGESARLVGRKEGRNLYRVTLVVRLPPFDRGDFILHERAPARILRLDGSRVILQPLTYGDDEELTLPLEKLSGGQRLGGPELAQPAQIVSRQGNEVLLLDPETMQTREVVLPAELDIEGDGGKGKADEGTKVEAATEIMVLRYQGQLYPLARE